MSRTLVVVGAFVLVSGCGGRELASADHDAGNASSSSGSSRNVPSKHRPDNPQCVASPPTVGCDLGGANAQCSADRQCVAASNGRCIPTAGGTCVCTYDSCRRDADCGPQRLCACNGSPDVGLYGSQCVAADCRVDSDCGPNGYCSPALDMPFCDPLPTYHCHTAADACLNDSDCASGQVCTFSGGRWVCSASPKCL